MKSRRNDRTRGKAAAVPGPSAMTEPEGPTAGEANAAHVAKAASAVDPVQKAAVGDQATAPVARNPANDANPLLRSRS
jgi:hypothetical protein